MAIESLKKVIKYNKMKGRRNIRVEKLLDLLEELVNDKMWKKIIDAERPTANSYQCRITRQAHNKAENILDKVFYLDTGEFKVYSSSVSEKCYKVSYNELCDDDCRTTYCEKCEICIHKYKCECSEFSIKTALCKHIQAVALVEKRSDSVSDSPTRSFNEDLLCIFEPTASKDRYQTEVDNFVEENVRRQESDVSIDQTIERQIKHEKLCMDISSLDDESFNKIESLVKDLKRKMGDASNIDKRKKMEKQVYFPIRK